MKINQIGSLNTRVSTIKQEKKVQNPIKQENKQITQLSNNYDASIVFTSKKKTSKDIKDYALISRAFTPETREIINLAKAVAQKSKSNEIESWHIYYANLLKLKKYIKELDEGVIKYDQDVRYRTPQGIETALYSNGSDTIFNKSEKREKVLKVIDANLKAMKKEFVQPSLKNPQKMPMFGLSLSKGAMNDLVEIYNMLSSAEEGNLFPDSYINAGALLSNDRKLVRRAGQLYIDLAKALMIEEIDNKNKNHLAFYDDKADALWKNLSIRDNAIVTCDLKNYAQLRHFKNSFANLINKPGQKYKNIDPEKTDVVILNKDATLSGMVDIIKDAKEKKDRTTVIFADFQTLLKKSGAQILPEEMEAFANIKSKDNQNIKLVLTMPPETYYGNTAENAPMSEIFKSYSVQTLPSLNINDTYKHLTNENGVKFIQKATGKEFSIPTIKKAIGLSLNKEGIYPDKAINLLNAVAVFNSEVDEITPQMVEKYVAETKDLSEISTKSSEGNVIFNTGLKLNDIVGTPMTKAEAKNLASRIKNGTFKTSGYTIYHAHGSSYGGGRKHTAFAIAGEAGIPVVTVDAKEFMLKDIDTLSQNADLSEMKIKKIFATAKAQAETNPNNTAMIFIENFDNFASNPLYNVSSIYEQKAFLQLLSEMEKARKNENIKLLIMGSVNMPELIDENILKPNKFLNSIAIYSPYTKAETKEVLDYHIKKMDLKIAGETQEEKDEIINEVAQTIKGFQVSDIMYLLDTTKNVMIERNKKAADLYDFTEAFLQVTTGRTAGSELNNYGKKIVTSHEAGHALTLKIMGEVLQKHGQNWQLPDEVNFITLDSRGTYGGAMYPKDSENQQTSFEKVMSDLVCTYGGHSTEKVIYDMKGSWGITSDMQHVNGLAKTAVLDMGMGPRVGVRHIDRDANGQPNVSDAKKMLIEQDIDSLIDASMKISDRIIETYQGFIEEFCKKHYLTVNTGKSVVTSKQFIKELNEWRDKQSAKEKEKFDKLEIEIIGILSTVKNIKRTKES